MKKPVIAFTIADSNNMPMAKKLLNSIRKFHSEEELPFIIIDDEKIKSYDDKSFFYRATPIIASELIKDYEVVLKLDCDQICMGDISHIWKHSDYDVATVLNINRVDPQVYGFVSTFVIDPNEYYNCGLVAMKNPDFIDNWLRLCYSKYFDRVRYKEQDLLNIMCFFGNWKVKCLDRYDKEYDIGAWWGLVAKGETIKMIKTDKGIVLPKGKDNYPDRDTIIKMYHVAGGSATKDKFANIRTLFTDEVMEYIDWLWKDKNE